RIDYFAPNRIEDINFAFEIRDAQEQVVYGVDAQTLQQPIHACEGVGAVCFDLPRVPLLDGTYPMSVAAMTRNGGKVYDGRDTKDSFEVMQPDRQRGRVAMEPQVVHYFHNSPAGEVSDADGDGPEASGSGGSPVTAAGS